MDPRQSVAIVVALLVASHAGARPLDWQDMREGRICSTTGKAPGAEVARHLHHLRRMMQAGMPVVLDGSKKDEGDIAVIEASVENGILVPVNRFDLRQRSLRFKRSRDGSYTAQFVTVAFDGTPGTKLDLADDDSEQISFGFSFKFYDKTYTSAWLNTDGNLTMDEGDDQSDARNFTRFNGLPRIGALFDDLNPQQGGEVTLAKSSDRVVITWNNVPEWSTGVALPPNRFQAVLYKSGDIQFNYSDTMSPKKAIVGITPSLSGNEVPQVADYTDEAPIGPFAGAIGEVFSDTAEVDYFSITRNFLVTHPDSFDQIMIWSTTGLRIISPTTGAFAFEQNIKNDVGGIGLETFDFSSFVGSSGRFHSIVVMDYLGKYPEDPREIFIGENSTLSVMGQESGHMWLAFTPLMENGITTQNILGRSDAHWSFYYDSDASVMEGNDIRDNGNGTFTTVDAVKRFSPLDQYVMGLIPPAAVPDSFYVAGPGARGREPEIGVLFSGQRTNVNINQIVQANGERTPSYDKSQHVFNQAFILLVKSGVTPAQEDFEKLDNIRSAWTDFFKNASSGRAVASTSLAGGTFQGTVRLKKGGAALSSIPVSISLKNYGLVQTVSSASDGSYSLTTLLPGSYTLTAKRGSKQIKKSVHIGTTETKTVDFAF